MHVSEILRALSMEGMFDVRTVDDAVDDLGISYEAIKCQGPAFADVDGVIYLEDLDLERFGESVKTNHDEAIRFRLEKFGMEDMDALRMGVYVFLHELAHFLLRHDPEEINEEVEVYLEATAGVFARICGYQACRDFDELMEVVDIEEEFDEDFVNKSFQQIYYRAVGTYEYDADVMALGLLKVIEKEVM